MTGPGCDEEEYMWPGPTYTDCRKCGKCTESYFDTLCEQCEQDARRNVTPQSDPHTPDTSPIAPD